MSDVEIIGLPHSNFVWAVRIALAEKGVAHTSTSAPPHSPPVTAIHPLGKVPVMRHGEVTLGESHAIIDYVDRVFPGPALVPADPLAASAVDMWTSIIVSTMEPVLIRQFLFAYFFPGTEDGSPDRVRIDASLPVLHSYLHLLDATIAAGTIGGNVFTRVDAYLVPILFYLRNTPEGGSAIAGRPSLTAYLDDRLTRPSVTSTMPPPPAG